MPGSSSWSLWSRRLGRERTTRSLCLPSTAKRSWSSSGTNYALRDLRNPSSELPRIGGVRAMAQAVTHCFSRSGGRRCLMPGLGGGGQVQASESRCEEAAGFKEIPQPHRPLSEEQGSRQVWLRASRLGGSRAGFRLAHLL